MKRIIYFIAAVFLLAGCEDVLEQKALTKGDAAVFPGSVENARQMLAGIYTTMNNEQRNFAECYFFINDVASDEKLGGGGANDVKAQAIENFQYSDPEMLKHTWQQTYSGIYRANVAIESLDNASYESEEQRGQFLGEAYLLRAYFYHRLATVFGEVPLTISSVAENLPAASADQIYGQMASDLKTAIELMPNDTYDNIQAGHATKWAAEALMARIFLFYTGFYQQQSIALPDGGTVTKQNVIDWLEDCINNSGHQLVGDFHELWPYTNSATIGDYDYIQDYMAETGKELVYASDNGARNPETVFALRFSNYSDWGVKRGYSNQAQLYYGLRGLQFKHPFAGGWGQGNSVPKTLVDQWMVDEPDDPRLWASVLDIEEELPTYNKGQWDFVMESNYWGKKYNGITAIGDDGSVKYDYSVVMYGNNNNNQLSHGDPMVYIRYADVLLMMSELTEDAFYMNQVRARVDLPPVSYSLENIQKERSHELAFEGLRWNDMRRWELTIQKPVLKPR